MNQQQANQELQWLCPALFCDAQIEITKTKAGILCYGTHRANCAARRLSAMHMTCCATGVKPFERDLKLQYEISRIVTEYVNGQLQ